MSWIRTPAIEETLEASRSQLRTATGFSPAGRPLSIHAQVAHCPAVLAACSSIGGATSDNGTVGQQVASAVMVVAAGVVGDRHTIAIASRVALGAGWRADQVEIRSSGDRLGDPKIDPLVHVLRDAGGHARRVSDSAWSGALAAGWTDEELTEAFACVGLSGFAADFLNYARTELDVRAPAPAPAA
jgi:hypothetical protein